GGDQPVDDGRGARAARDDRWQPATANRPRVGDRYRRRESFAQGIPANAADAEADGEGEAHQGIAHRSRPALEKLKEVLVVRKDSTAAHRRKEAPVLPAGGGRYAFTTRWQVHRDPRYLRPNDRTREAQHRRGEDQGLAAKGGAPFRHRAGILDRTGPAPQGIREEATD